MFSNKANNTQPTLKPNPSVCGAVGGMLVYTSVADDLCFHHNVIDWEHMSMTD